MLAEYLASEQAREDVGRMVDTLHTSIGARFWGHRDDLCLDGSKEGAWHRVAFWDPQADRILLPAYYRPDDARFVVTDLGEGVRALRLRTGERAYGPATGAAMLEKLTLCNIEDSRGNVGALGGLARELELVDVKAAYLPAAICRVMLASLRVAEVGR